MKQDFTIDNRSKNLTYEERLYIENRLNEGHNFTNISELLKRNRKTISREVKGRRFARTKDPALKKQKCAYLGNCTKTNLCSFKYCTGDVPCSKCKFNRTCAQYCDDYVPGTCPKLLKPPYICNDCNRMRVCGYDKMYYRASYAEDSYRENMSESRKGVDLSPEEVDTLDKLITPLILKGQPISHIYNTLGDKIPCSRRSIYNYVDQGILRVRNIDLRRKVKYKPRKKKRLVGAVDYKYRDSRTYKDFTKHLTLNPEVNVVEMDVVAGTKGGKAFLTLFFRNTSLMMIFLIDSITQSEVFRVFDEIYCKIGLEGFKKDFPIILTDNGSEFKNSVSLEYDSYGDRRTRIFYCDPYKSYQKGRIEKNHEFIRYVLAKGKTFDKLTQSDATLLANNINSISRDSLNGKTPMELSELLINDILLKEIGLHQITADEVRLTPSLIG